MPMSGSRAFMNPFMPNPANPALGYPNFSMMGSLGSGFYGQNMARMPFYGPYPYGPGFNYPSNLGFAGMKVHQNRYNMSRLKRPSGDEVSRFAGVMLEDVVGKIHSICKDQHGCRFLQKRIEEGNQKHIEIIFNEVAGHFIELMTDPFGNYLCQKIFEHCNDDQRTKIVEAVSPDLVTVSLNMHGTRATQKLLEHLTTTQQICTAMRALSMNVVTLIKDLNGNHVIQKCLTCLSPEHNQFVYDAVTTHCVEVATHRHGCCVLQRCIDHATESQRTQLVDEITHHALTLVQDPFGNYVVQYVLDLSNGRYADALIRRFVGSVWLLSVQKFSSNVIEKCIRVAQADTRKALIDEMLNRERLEQLLRDSYGNYVVQTALDLACSTQKSKLIEAVRLLLPSIRNTPHGKRLHSKLHRETFGSNSVPSGFKFRHPKLSSDMAYRPFPSLVNMPNIFM
ncbi:hypothetical protein HK104_000637 [Borealophlyctis nickersoniae]|nr:hypothetical protein HK104_000637 [Borealophlyctis nickersoniae]